MTIRNMTIILNILKYDNLQYDNYFEKIVIFAILNMTKTKFDECFGQVKIEVQFPIIAHVYIWKSGARPT